MSLPVTPLGSLLFIEPMKIESDTVAVVIDPRKSWRGRVLAAGLGAPLPDGGYAPMDVKVGDVVYLSPTKAVEAVFGQTHVWVTDEANILAVEAAA